MTTFGQIASKIIKEQALIIGPLAWLEAQKVVGLKIINKGNGELEVTGEPKKIIDSLVARYERLFGHASKEVCREAVQDLISEIDPSEVPDSLK